MKSPHGDSHTDVAFVGAGLSGDEARRALVSTFAEAARLVR